MADRTWQIEHRGDFRLALRRATSLPQGNNRDYVSYKTLVRWRFACALRGSARGFWFIDPLGLRPRGLCTVATRACHVNHAPPSYNLLAPAHPKFNILLQMQTVVADVCGNGREYKLTLHVGDKKRMGSGGVIILLPKFLSMELTPPTAH